MIRPNAICFLGRAFVSLSVVFFYVTHAIRLRMSHLYVSFRCVPAQEAKPRTGQRRDYLPTVLNDNIVVMVVEDHNECNKGGINCVPDKYWLVFFLLLRSKTLTMFCLK